MELVFKECNAVMTQEHSSNSVDILLLLLQAYLRSGQLAVLLYLYRALNKSKDSILQALAFSTPLLVTKEAALSPPTR